MIDMFDFIFYGVEVDVGYSDVIIEVYLDECFLNIILKNSSILEERELVLGFVLVFGLGIMVVLVFFCSWEYLFVFDRIFVIFFGR